MKGHIKYNFEMNDGAYFKTCSANNFVTQYSCENYNTNFIIFQQDVTRKAIGHKRSLVCK